MELVFFWLARFNSSFLQKQTAKNYFPCTRRVHYYFECSLFFQYICTVVIFILIVFRLKYKLMESNFFLQKLNSQQVIGVHHQLVRRNVFHIQNAHRIEHVLTFNALMHVLVVYAVWMRDAKFTIIIQFVAVAQAKRVIRLKRAIQFHVIHHCHQSQKMGVHHRHVGHSQYALCDKAIQFARVFKITSEAHHIVGHSVC